MSIQADLSVLFSGLSIVEDLSFLEDKLAELVKVLLSLPAGPLVRPKTAPDDAAREPKQRYPSQPSEPPPDPLAIYKGDLRGSVIRGILEPTPDKKIRRLLRRTLAVDLNLTLGQVASASGYLTGKKRYEHLIPSLTETLMLMSRLGLSQSKYRSLGAKI